MSPAGDGRLPVLSKRMDREPVPVMIEVNQDTHRPMIRSSRWSESSSRPTEIEASCTVLYQPFRCAGDFAKRSPSAARKRARNSGSFARISASSCPSSPAVSL
jgi:hypothetical protein